ncbi:hypothetical protein BDW02DRAFT_633376 [Decorospora gaudefroyi]|uniref:Uncharacterized protein n=1 Tax=Decorospora gaudefroyi TaxID=184978 RepID=A0A6A5K827_9PLEO|nr:hypothetical protein BDW02DRAFT_633376 [Decorospora gaudefroyi]
MGFSYQSKRGRRPDKKRTERRRHDKRRTELSALYDALEAALNESDRKLQKDRKAEDKRLRKEANAASIGSDKPSKDLLQLIKRAQNKLRRSGHETTEQMEDIELFFAIDIALSHPSYAPCCHNVDMRYRTAPQNPLLRKKDDRFFGELYTDEDVYALRVFEVMGKKRQQRMREEIGRVRGAKQQQCRGQKKETLVKQEQDIGEESLGEPDIKVE